MPTTSPIFIASSGRGGLLDGLAGGIVADGSYDNTDRIAELVQFAIDNNYSGLRLPEGVTMISGDTSTHRLGIDLRGLTHFTLAGSGPNSILRMTKEFAQDRRLVYIANNSATIVVRDLTLDGNWDGESGNEQIHGIQVGYGEADGGCTEVQILNCRFINFKGDGLRLIGHADGLVEQVQVANSTFIDCDRCGIAVQRGVRGLQLTNVYMEGGSDQGLDMEGSGESPPRWFQITNLRIVKDGSSDAMAATFSGNSGGVGDQLHRESFVQGMHVENGAIQVTRAQGIAFSNCVINGRDGATESTIELTHEAEDITLSNVLASTGADSTGAVVHCVAVAGAQPKNIKLIGGTYTQAGAGNILEFEDTDRLDVLGSELVYTGASPSNFAGLSYRAIVADIGNVRAWPRVVGDGGGSTLLRGIHFNASLTSSITNTNVHAAQTSGCVTDVEYEKNVGATFGGTNIGMPGATTAGVGTAVTLTAIDIADVDGLQTELDALEDAVDDLEAAATVLDTRLDTAESDISALETADGVLDGRLDAVEANNWVTTARIADDQVTNAKLAEVSTATFKGRTTAGTGNPEDLTATQATALLNTVTTAAKGLVPTAPNLTTQFFRGDAAWAALPKQKYFLEFGGAVMTAGTTDRFANPAGFSTSPLAGVNLAVTVGFSGNLVKIHYRVTTAHTTSTVTVTPRLNNVEQTTQTCSVAATTLAQSFTLATPLTVSSGDSISCQLDHNGATNLANLSIIFEFEF